MYVFLQIDLLKPVKAVADFDKCRHNVSIIIPQLAKSCVVSHLIYFTLHIVDSNKRYAVVNVNSLLRDHLLQPLHGSSSVSFLVSLPHVGLGQPPFPPSPIHFTIFYSILYCSLFSFLARFIFFLVHPFPFYQNRHSISRPEIVGSDRTWV